MPLNLSKADLDKLEENRRKFVVRYEHWYDLSRDKTVEAATMVFMMKLVQAAELALQYKRDFIKIECDSWNERKLKRLIHPFKVGRKFIYRHKARSYKIRIVKLRCKRSSQKIFLDKATLARLDELIKNW